MRLVYGKLPRFVSILEGFYAQQGPETLHKKCVRKCGVKTGLRIGRVQGGARFDSKMGPHKGENAA